MWIFFYFLIGSLGPSLPDKHTTTPPPISKPSPTSTHPPTFASVTPSPSLIPVLSSIGSVCAVVLLMLVVLVVKRWVCGKPKEDAEEVRENDITDGIIYSEIITSNHQQQPVRQSPESDPGAVYSTVRRDDATYGRIIIKNKKKQSKRRESDPATIYSEVRTSYEQIGFRANRPTDFLEPEVIYSNLQ